MVHLVIANTSCNFHSWNAFWTRWSPLKLLFLSFHH